MAEAAKLTGVERAAVLLMAVGEEYAAEILKHMEPRELHNIGTTMASLANINREQVSETLQTFNDQVENLTSMGVHSEDYIRAVLIRALGRDKAKAVMERILSAEKSSGVEALKWIEAGTIASALRKEHPQIIALLLASLDTEQAAEVVNHLPADLHSEVMLRVATLDNVPAGAMKELNDLIEKQMMNNIHASASTKLGGTKKAADILNLLDNGIEASILDNIKSADQSLGEEIENLMLIFENLLDVDDRSIQSLLREVSTDVLLVALRGADEMVQEKLLRNMSKRAAEMLRDDLEAMAPVRLADVEAAQREMLTTAKRLAEAGELSLGSKGKDQLV